jgi:hypothetical protein
MVLRTAGGPVAIAIARRKGRAGAKTRHPCGVSLADLPPAPHHNRLEPERIIKRPSSLPGSITVV